MLIGRITGWFLVAIAIVMASAEAVLAFGLKHHTGIATGEVVTLLTGGVPASAGTHESLLANAEHLLMQMPAWVVIGALGTILLLICRRRHRRFIFVRR